MTEVLEKIITVQEFREMDFPDNDFFIYELINGIIMRKAAPQPVHQDISIEIEFAIKLFLRQNPIGKMYHAPVDVFLDNHNQCQPDILFIQKDREFIIDPKNGIFGTPDLVVEIISPGSVTADRVNKKELYERFAVKEYWLVDPSNRTVELYILKDNRYIIHQFLEIVGQIESTVLDGLTINMSDLF